MSDTDLPLIQEARKTWWEIVESDGGECRLMGIVRELADEVERATRLIRTLCNRAPASPGCIWPRCDCGER